MGVPEDNRPIPEGWVKQWDDNVSPPSPTLVIGRIDRWAVSAGRTSDVSGYRDPGRYSRTDIGGADAPSVLAANHRTSAAGIEN